MIRNVRERQLGAPAGVVGPLIDSLTGPDDRLWPHELWPRMRFDRPLGVGARGGHGPIRYRVEECVPGSRILYRVEAREDVDVHH